MTDKLSAHTTPIGIMAISAPSEKKPIPMISSAAPKMNSISVPVGMGVSVKLRRRTINVIGRTEESASLIFSFKFFPHACTSLSFFQKE